MDPRTAREELAAIRSLMAESQGFLYGSWPYQLVWGLLGAAGMVATWLALVAGTTGPIAWIWIGMIVVGWAFSLHRMRLDSDGSPVRNVASRAFGGIWTALGVTLTLLGTVTVFTGAIEPAGLPGLIAVVFGSGYYASGVLAGMRWLRGVALLWWVGGVALLVWRGPIALLVLAAMTLLLEVGPALVLRHRERSATRA